tara:strand:+ start:976 stop:1980 length:1005 start_codon:yes stop_codon:yes gene_type:complete
LLSACVGKNENNTISQQFSGETQGTTYSIILSDSGESITQVEIDSLLHEFDLSLSTYIDHSVISKLNASKGTFLVSDHTHFFKDCYEISQYIYKLTNGEFDPSVFPLVKAWGFMNNMKSPLDQKSVDSLLKFVSFSEGVHHNMQFSGDKIHLNKIHDNFKLDFNAVAQGQSVDVVCEYIESKGYHDFYVEIGGELRTSGVNREALPWKVGIDSPQEALKERVLDNILNLTNNAVATSGNYRKFYEIDGVKYSHTLSPKTGYPVRHSLLSATVIARTCAEADAYATAFMVMGLENSLTFVQNNPAEELEVYLLYSDDNGEIVRAMSNGFKAYCAY